MIIFSTSISLLKIKKTNHHVEEVNILEEFGISKALQPMKIKS